MVDKCIRCGATLKFGMISANQSLTKSQTHVINLDSVEPIDAACNKRGDELYNVAKTKLDEESKQLSEKLKALLPRVPVVSLQQPMGWTYEPISIITAQTVTGTGLFSDVTSAFTDLFGTQSGTYNAKLRVGEDQCKASLRLQTLELGGNAVAGVDVDYAEVGGQRAMLMVCMTGTAIRIFALDEPDETFFSTLDGAQAMAKRRRVISRALAAPV